MLVARLGREVDCGVLCAMKYLVAGYWEVRELHRVHLCTDVHLIYYVWTFMMDVFCEVSVSAPSTCRCRRGAQRARIILI